MTADVSIKSILKRKSGEGITGSREGLVGSKEVLERSIGRISFTNPRSRSDDSLIQTSTAKKRFVLWFSGKKFHYDFSCYSSNRIRKHNFSVNPDLIRVAKNVRICNTVLPPTLSGCGSILFLNGSAICTKMSPNISVCRDYYIRRFFFVFFWLIFTVYVMWQSCQAVGLQFRIATSHKL